MDHHSILSGEPENSAARVTPDGAGRKPASAQERIAKALHFPGDDGGLSLTEMARRDLQATLQLLAERAQYITGASGAAIALWEDELMVCRASAGGSAPEVGTHLQVNSGLSGESVRSRQILRCDDAETDARVNRESCHALGIRSVVVMPLIREQDVAGVFELFSDKPHAFAERDVTALERMGEMIHTALLHADAARQVEREAQRQEAQVAAVVEKAAPSSPPAGETEEDLILPVEQAASTSEPGGPLISLQYPSPPPAPSEPALAGALGQLGKCEVCGFPVSPGRAVCVDCEAARSLGEQAAPSVPKTEAIPAAEVPAFLSQYAAMQSGRGDGLGAHKYFIATLILAALVSLILILAQAGLLRLPS